MARPTHVFEQSQRIPRPRDKVFAFFADAANLQQLTPSFLDFRILTPLPIVMEVGARIDYSLRLFGLPVRWRTRITDWQPGYSFVDEQESGPYAVWIHTHRFESEGEHTVMHDRVEYAVPLGPLGRIAHALVVKRTLNRIFEFRRETVDRIFAPAHAAADPRP